MKFTLENAKEYYLKYDEANKLMKFRSFVESLDRDDITENKLAIQSLIEGVDAIIEATVPKNIIDSYTKNAEHQTLKNKLGESGVRSLQGQSDITSKVAQKLLREGKTELATAILIGSVAPIVASKLNSLPMQHEISSDDMADAFAEIMSVIAKQVPKYDPESPIPFYPSMVHPILYKSLIPNALYKTTGSKLPRQWDPSLHYSNVNTMVYHDGKTYKRQHSPSHNDPSIEPSERPAKNLPYELKDIPPNDPRVAEWWLEIDTPKVIKDRLIQDSEGHEVRLSEFARDAQTAKDNPTGSMVDDDYDPDSIMWDAKDKYADDFRDEIEDRLEELYSKLGAEKVTPTMLNRINSELKTAFNDLGLTEKASDYMVDVIANASIGKDDRKEVAYLTAQLANAYRDLRKNPEDSNLAMKIAELRKKKDLLSVGKSSDSAIREKHGLTRTQADKLNKELYAYLGKLINKPAEYPELYHATVKGKSDPEILKEMKRELERKEKAEEAMEMDTISSRIKQKYSF